MIHGRPRRLIAVVLNSQDTYADVSTMLDYGFGHISSRGEWLGAPNRWWVLPFVLVLGLLYKRVRARMAPTRPSRQR